jgi:hypothetical protein
MYTFWSYWRNRYERDAGLRIDHLLLSPALRPRLLKAGVDRAMRGKPGPQRPRAGMDHLEVGLRSAAPATLASLRKSSVSSEAPALVMSLSDGSSSGLARSVAVSHGATVAWRRRSSRTECAMSKDITKAAPLGMLAVTFI